MLFLFISLIIIMIKHRVPTYKALSTEISRCLYFVCYFWLASWIIEIRHNAAVATDLFVQHGDHLINRDHNDHCYSRSSNKLYWEMVITKSLIVKSFRTRTKYRLCVEVLNTNQTCGGGSWLFVSSMIPYN